MVPLPTLAARGERLLQAHTLIGQELQLPSSDWTRATLSSIFCPIRVGVCNNRSPLSGT